MKFSNYLTVCQVTLALTLAGTIAKADSVAFDNIQESQFGGSGFCCGIQEIAQSVTLAGTGRYVSEVDVPLGDSARDEFRVRVYSVDSGTGQPTTVLWESPIQTFPTTPPFYAQTTVKIAVPEIVVPDSLAVSVLPLSGTGLTDRAGLTPPIVGTQNLGWYRQSDNLWHLGNTTDIFGVRVEVVPEPSSAALGTLVGSCIFGCARRRRD